ncbi:hypothetical protein M407DRAFT_168717 [Tulasnella calospora MUT 4182]|uniref:Uncharacterized protein n=1 Tax=Tulasnella calospora MUT 4182 TaxID=1051891 RepID=A0A0C3L6N7_9AGAM|nr:hypothetical protein M407DRAFT_168717 [Tulasnella calospora MUT 4182]
MPRQPQIVSLGEEISMEPSLNRIRDLDFGYSAMTEVKTATVTILPDGAVVEAGRITPTIEGLHILRSTIRWVQPNHGVGVLASKKVREVIVTKPFFAVRSTVKPDDLGYMGVSEPQSTVLPTDRISREDDDGPIIRSSREEVLRLYAFMALLLVLWIVWSKVTRCRVSGR